MGLAIQARAMAEFEQTYCRVYVTFRLTMLGKRFTKRVLEVFETVLSNMDNEVN